MRWKRIHGVLHTSLWRQRAPSREQGTLRGETPDCLCEVGTGGFGGGHPEKDKPLAIGCFWLEALRAQWVPLEARPWNLGFISSECWLQRLQCTCCPVGPGDWGGGGGVSVWVNSKKQPHQPQTPTPKERLVQKKMRAVSAKIWEKGGEGHSRICRQATSS